MTDLCSIFCAPILNEARRDRAYEAFYDTLTNFELT